MSAVTAERSRRIALPGTLGARVDLPALAAWLLPFALIVGLAFAGGGYDPIVRGQVGVAAWWLVIVGALAGVLPLRHGRLGWAALGLLAAFLVWSALALSWTESTERTVAEIGRVATYLALLVLALGTQGRVAARHAINGAACAIATVGAVAVLSRLHPQWFTTPAVYETFPQSRARLAFPLGYWNLLAGLIAMGIPPLLALASTARTMAGRTLAAAALPVQGLCVYLTVSRGGLGAVAAALVVFFLVAPDRLPRLALLAVAGLGTAILCVAADRRDEVRLNVEGAAALRQGDELLGLVAFVCVGVGLLALAIALVDRHVERPRWMVVPRRAAVRGSAVAALAAIAAFVLAGGPGWAHDRFESFKGTPTAGISGNDLVGRLSSVSSNGRWDYWMAAQHAALDERPLGGLGPGTFEFYWARAGTPTGGFVRDAHSVWFQTLAETGLVGLALLAALFLLALVAGAVRALRARSAEQRVAIAAACGGVAAFVVIASFEWAWQMTVLPAAALVLVAVALRGADDPPLLRARTTGEDSRRGVAPLPPRPAAFRAGAALAGLCAVVAVAIPLTGVSNVRASESLARKGDTAAALKRARDAQAAQPYGASARLQQALVLERAGDLVAAVAAARKATADEPTNWRVWLVRSRLEARTGDAQASLASYRRGRSLNPRSRIFTGQ